VLDLGIHLFDLFCLLNALDELGPLFVMGVKREAKEGCFGFQFLLAVAGSITDNRADIGLSTAKEALTGADSGRGINGSRKLGLECREARGRWLLKAEGREVPFEDGNPKSGMMEVLGPGRWAIDFDMFGS